MELQGIDISMTSVSDLFDGYYYITTLIISLLILYIWYFLKRPYNLPPGPYGFPLIGCARELSDQVSVDFTQLAKKYGDLFCLWMGGDKYIVVLNSYEIIKEAFITRGAEFSDRIPIETLGGMDSIEPMFNGHYGQDHIECRKIVANSSRTFINTRLELVMQDQMMKISDYIHAVDSVPVSISNLYELVMTNIFSAWHFNKTYSLHDSELKEITNGSLQYSYAFESSTRNLYSANTYFTRSVKSAEQVCASYFTFVKKELKDHVANLDPINPNDLMDEFINNNLHNKYGADTMGRLMLVLTTDATYTTSSTINWLVAYYVHYPEFQKAILKEIYSLGLKGDQRVCLANKKDMPFTEAFIMEVQRITGVFQITGARTPSHTTTLRGYTIPKGVIMVGNLNAVHKNPHLIPEPDKFRPERFLKNGKLSPIDRFIPFGVGRRICVGEQIVKNCMFYLFTNLVMKYDIVQDPPTTLNQRLHGKIVCKLEDFEVIFRDKCDSI